jgi:hypothetical protein
VTDKQKKTDNGGQIAFEIDPELKRRFNSKRSLEGRQAKDVLAELILGYVESGSRLEPPITSEPQTPAFGGSEISAIPHTGQTVQSSESHQLLDRLIEIVPEGERRIVRVLHAALGDGGEDGNSKSVPGNKPEGSRPKVKEAFREFRAAIKGKPRPPKVPDGTPQRRGPKRRVGNGHDPSAKPGTGETQGA